MLKVLHGELNVDIIDMNNLPKNGFEIGMTLYGTNPLVTDDTSILIDGNIFSQEYRNLYVGDISPSNADTKPLRTLDLTGFYKDHKVVGDFMYHKAEIISDTSLNYGKCILERIDESINISDTPLYINLVLWSAINLNTGYIFPLRILNVNPININVDKHIQFGSLLSSPMRPYSINRAGLPDMYPRVY